MRIVGALIGTAVAIGCAAPALADPGDPAVASPEQVAAAADAGFLGALQAAGITYTNPAQVISAGRAVCGLAARGESGLGLVADIKAQNPGFSTDGAAQFAAISARSFCPQQLVHK